MKPCVWVIAWWVCVVGSRAPGQDAPRASLTVATYNVQNMLDAFDDPYALDERTPAKPREQIAKIARAVRKLDADVVAFQEIENEGLLRAVVREYLGGMGYSHIVVGQTNSIFGQNLGVISRKPIVSVTSHRWMEIAPAAGQGDWPVRFARDLMRVEIQATPTRRLHLLNVHLKSRRDGRDDPGSTRWRSAEAGAVRSAVESLLVQDPGAWVLAVGDFNDTPGSAAIRALLAPAAGGRPLLVDVHKGLPPANRVTYLLEPHRDTVDYILATPALAGRLGPGGAVVLEEQPLLEGSDHAPIVAAFDLGVE